MSSWLVAFIGTVYAYIAAEQFYRGNPAMGIMYAGYAFSNVGLWWLTK
jgi:hypothetical protein